jgi:hypothetical protein
LEERIGFPAMIPTEPFMTGALGASIIAQELAAKVGQGDLMEKKKARTLAAATFFDEDQ